MKSRMMAVGAMALMLSSPNFSCKGPLTGADMGDKSQALKKAEEAVKERKPANVVPVRTEVRENPFQIGPGILKPRGKPLEPEIKPEQTMH